MGPEFRRCVQSAEWVWPNPSRCFYFTFRKCIHHIVSITPSAPLFQVLQWSINHDWKHISSRIQLSGVKMTYPKSLLLLFKVEMVCNLLSLTDLNEQTLPKLCSSVLTPSHDLSYVTATTFIKSLLLKKVHEQKWFNTLLHLMWYDKVLLCLQVLSLSEPASRCLVTAATSLCSYYPRPMCQAVFLPVLEENNIGVKKRLLAICSIYVLYFVFVFNFERCLFSGNPHSELLNRLIENCLDSHYRLLVLQ